MYRKTKIVPLFLALFALLMTTMALSTRPLLAAPPAQDNSQAKLAGAYVSESFLAADNSLPQFILVLDESGEAQLIATPADSDDITLEEATWSVDGDTLTLTIIGDYVTDYDEPIEVVFQVQDGALVAVEYDAQIFGDEGVTLLREDAVEDDNAEPDSITFQSDVLPAADTPGRKITLVVTEDGKATWSTDYMNDEPPIVEVGFWETNDEDETVTIVITGREDKEYLTPIEITFALSDEGALEAVDYDQDLFGSEGLTLYLADNEPTELTEALLEEEASSGDPSGVYVSDILPAASSPGRVILLILYPDGSLQSGVYYLNNELPISEVGEWSIDDDGALVVSITGTFEEEYSEPNDMAFVWEEDTLTSGSIVLHKVEEAAQVSEATPIAYYMSEILPAASSPGREISLVFYDDGSAEMTTDYLNDEPPIVEIGKWSENNDGSFTLTLTGRPDMEYDTPTVITFEIDGEQLVAVEWDESLYGSEGLTLTEQSLDVLNQKDGDVDDSEMMSVPEGAVAIFTAENLPAASSPGRTITLVLFDDFSATMTSDYQNDEAPIIEYGEWSLNDDDTLTLTLLGADGRDYERPMEIVFEQTEDGVTAIEYDATIYGSEGLELETVYLSE